MRPTLRWADFWSTYDPAPAGPLNPPDGVRLTNRTYSIINRMSILEDHGSYWDNDEEFILPLLQHIDTPAERPEAVALLPRSEPGRRPALLAPPTGGGPGVCGAGLPR